MNPESSNVGDTPAELDVKRPKGFVTSIVYDKEMTAIMKLDSILRNRTEKEVWRSESPEKLPKYLLHACHDLLKSRFLQTTSFGIGCVAVAYGKTLQSVVPLFKDAHSGKYTVPHYVLILSPMLTGSPPIKPIKHISLKYKKLSEPTAVGYTHVNETCSLLNQSPIYSFIPSSSEKAAAELVAAVAEIMELGKNDVFMSREEEDAAKESLGNLQNLAKIIQDTFNKIKQYNEKVKTNSDEFNKYLKTCVHVPIIIALDASFDKENANVIKDKLEEIKQKSIGHVDTGKRYELSQLIDYLTEHHTMLLKKENLTNEAESATKGIFHMLSKMMRHAAGKSMLDRVSSCSKGIAAVEGLTMRLLGIENDYEGSVRLQVVHMIEFKKVENDQMFRKVEPEGSSEKGLSKILLES